MKRFAYLLIVFISFPVSLTYGDDKATGSIHKYDTLITEYFESLELTEIEEYPSASQVIIYDANANITRQIEIREDLELSVPGILKPVIHKAVFLTRIQNTYYFLCD